MRHQKPILFFLMMINSFAVLSVYGFTLPDTIPYIPNELATYKKQETYIEPRSTLNAYSLLDSIPLQSAKSPYIMHNPWIRQSIAPAFLLTTSFLTWGSRENIRETRNRYTPNFSVRLDDYLQYAPAVGVFGLKLAGNKGLNDWKRSAINWGAGMVIMGAMVNSIKYSARVMRPDGSSRNSFPSGHTATAFMNATFMHKEYGQVNPLYSIAGYASSSYVGASRSLNNRHWISDILAGAAIGIISTELAYGIVDHFYKNKGDYFSGFTLQEEINKPSYFSVRLGYSYEIEDASFRTLGIESSIEGAYYFNKKWGVVGNVTFGDYPISNDEIEADDIKIQGSDLINPHIEYQSLGMLYFTAGPQYAKTIGSKFMLQAQLVGGLSMGINGKMNLMGELQNANADMKSDIVLPLMDYQLRPSLVVGCGASFTAMVTPRAGLTWFVDYKFSRPTFDITTSRETFGDQLESLDLSERISINNISSGLRFTAFFD